MASEVSPKLGWTLVSLAVVALGSVGYLYFRNSTGTAGIDSESEKAKIEISNKQLEGYIGTDPSQNGEAAARGSSSNR